MDAIMGVLVWAFFLGGILAFVRTLVLLERPALPNYACIACGYDLRGVTDPRVCPECGDELVGQRSREARRIGRASVKAASLAAILLTGMIAALPFPLLIGGMRGTIMAMGLIVVPYLFIAVGLGACVKKSSLSGMRAMAGLSSLAVWMVSIASLILVSRDTDAQAGLGIFMIPMGGIPVGGYAMYAGYRLDIARRRRGSA